MSNIYLFSKTFNPNVQYIPILNTTFFTKNINFDNYDAIVITSKQAIVALENISPLWREKKILSIAKMSEELASKYGASLLQRGDGYGDSLLDIITTSYSTLRWLYPRPQVVASDFCIQAKHAGINIEDVVVYETTCNDECALLDIKAEDVLIFTSPFTIECFLKYYSFSPLQRVVSIGRTTSKALPTSVKVFTPVETSIDACVDLANKLLLNSTRDSL